METRKLFGGNYATIFFVILILFILTGCGTAAGAIQPGTEGSRSGETGSGGIDLGEIGTIEVGIEPTPLPQSSSYANETYGFAFDYPVTWTLSEEDHRVVLQKGTNRLGINFRWVDEQTGHFGRTGMGAGDLIYAGKVNFMDQVIPAEALLYEKKSKAVFYGESSQIETGNLVFVIALEDLETDYLKVDLTDEIITEANRILESFRPIEAAGADSSAGPSGLEAYLKVQNSVSQGSGEPIMVDFLLVNHAQEALYLLKWYTPLEGIAGEIFQVTRDGQPIPYLGPLVSRGAPTPEAYIFLEPDKGVTAEVNIAQAYDFSQPGTYSIKFRSPRISHLARSEAEMATSLDELGPVNIPSKEVTLEVVGSSTGIGQPIRRTTEQAAEIISAHLLAQKPGLMEAPPLTFEEVPAERVWKELQGQVFRVTEGLFQNESFLLRHDNVIQLGEALGGQGLTSLVVCDLDQDGQSEMIFTYAAGLGPGIGPGIQTRVGMLESDSEPLRVVEADLAYLGYAALRLEETTAVSLNVVESNQATKVLRYLDRLGYLSIENREAGVSLILNVDPELSPEVKQNILLRQ